MKFIYDGEYREFRGYVFKWSKPTEVTDRATIEALLKDPSFWRCDEEAKEAPEAPAKQTAAERNPHLADHVCHKCGRHVRRGRYLHVKHCKGPK